MNDYHTKYSAYQSVNSQDEEHRVNLKFQPKEETQRICVNGSPSPQKIVVNQRKTDALDISDPEQVCSHKT